MRFFIRGDSGQLTVAAVDRDIDSRRVEPEDLADHPPGKLDGLAFEVIANRPVAYHLEKGEIMPVTDVVNVVGPHAPLDVAETLVRRNFLAREEWLERSHSGIDDKQRGIINGE
jgi:hypothetical protein